MKEKYLAILGRERDLSMAELERVYGADNLELFGVSCLLAIKPDIRRLGGSPKVGEVIEEFEHGNKQQLLLQVEALAKEILSKSDKKAKFGLSSYGSALSKKDLSTLSIKISKDLRKSGMRVRAVPNREAVLNAAQVWHNRLDKDPNLELLIVVSGKNTVIAKTIGVQDIESYTKRDRDKPARDSRIGMLPPKLAKTMINLASPKEGGLVLDPFCGSGTVLMEALEMGYKAYGTDVSQDMVEASRVNLAWFAPNSEIKIELADAQSAKWDKVDAVVAETFLGPPLTSLPNDSELSQVIAKVNKLLTRSLTNLANQLPSETPLCLAVPAWHDKRASKFIHLPLVDELSHLGYNRVDLKSVRGDKLIYHRPGQTVARQILIIRRNHE